MYDVIVVGARCAGSPLATLLARDGWRVLVLDRSTFPSEPLCLSQVSISGLERLRRWGVTDGGRAPRRLVLDEALVNAACRAGADVRLGFAVRDLVWNRDRVTGVIGHGSDGHTVCELASVVVGADGRRSLVAEAAGAATLTERPATRCCYYAYWTGVELTGPEWFATDGGAVGILPSGDGVACVVVVLSVTEWAAFKSSPEAIYGRHTAGCRGLTRGSRQTRLFGTADLGTATRAPWGPGWALVGDAGRHTDPFESGGIAEAFLQAELLAEALDNGLSEAPQMDSALARYERLLAVGEKCSRLDGRSQMVAQNGIRLLEAFNRVLDGAGDALAGPLGI